MRILITGATGYLGALLAVQLEKTHEVLRTSRKLSEDPSVVKLDVTDRRETKARIVEHAPDVILHSAAIANVAACEANADKAVQINVGGTENVVDAANACAARVVLISSLAARDLSSVYGRTKRDAEARVRSVEAGYEVLQLSMTFGISPNRTNARPFNKILSTFRTGYPDTYDNSWRFQPTDASHLLKIIEDLLQRPFMGRTLPISITESCTMHQLASDVLAPMHIRAADLYPERMTKLIASSELAAHGFTSSSYEELVGRLQRQLSQEA